MDKLNKESIISVHGQTLVMDPARIIPLELGSKFYFHYLLFIRTKRTLENNKKVMYHAHPNMHACTYLHRYDLYQIFSW